MSEQLNLGGIVCNDMIFRDIGTVVSKKELYALTKDVYNKSCAININDLKTKSREIEIDLDNLNDNIETNKMYNIINLVFLLIFIILLIIIIFKLYF